MNEMNENKIMPPDSKGGLVFAVIGSVLLSTFFFSFLAVPFCLTAWILGTKAVNRARRMGVGAGGAAITAKVMGSIGTIFAVATLFLTVIVCILHVVDTPGFAGYNTAFELAVDNEDMINNLFAHNPQKYTLASGEKDYAKLNKDLEEILLYCDARIQGAVRARLDAMGLNRALIQSQNSVETVNGIERTVHGLLVLLSCVDENVRTEARERLSARGHLEFRPTHPEEDALLAEIQNKGVNPEGYAAVAGGYRRAANFEETSAKPGYAERLRRFEMRDPRWHFMLLPDRGGNPFASANDIVYRPHIVSAVPGNVTGDDIVRARAKPHTGLGDYVIEFELSSDGGKKFHKLTSENRNRNLAIILDGTLISAPVINCAISTEGMIVGDFTKAEADRLADSLNSGSLPASLKILSQTCDTPAISKKASGAKATRP